VRPALSLSRRPVSGAAIMARTGRRSSGLAQVLDVAAATLSGETLGCRRGGGHSSTASVDNFVGKSPDNARKARIFGPCVKLLKL
jgi:hypothetical protein